MIKILVVSCMVFMVSGCGKYERAVANVTGYSKQCIDGVSYIQFSSGATVQVDVNGKPIACK